MPRPIAAGPVAVRGREEAPNPGRTGRPFGHAGEVTGAGNSESARAGVDAGLSVAKAVTPPDHRPINLRVAPSQSWMVGFWLAETRVLPSGPNASEQAP